MNFNEVTDVIGLCSWLGMREGKMYVVSVCILEGIFGVCYNICGLFTHAVTIVMILPANLRPLRSLSLSLSVFPAAVH